MSNTISQFESIIQKVLKFRNERNWKKYHTPRNLASSIAIEAAEILEIFQWDLSHQSKLNSREKVTLADEIADVMIYCLLLAHESNIDPYEAIIEKIEKNAIKYPIRKPEST